MPEIFPQADSFHDDGTWHIEVQPLGGARLGVINEIVFYKHTVDKLSLLEWEQKPVWFLGGKISGGWKGLTLSFSGKRFFPGECGIVRDSDWASDHYNKDGDRSTKTDYSETKNYLRDGWELELDLAAKFYPVHFFSLSPHVAAEMKFFDFYSKNGTAWYGKQHKYSWDNSAHNNVLKFYDTTVLEYKRLEIYAWMGLYGEFNVNKWRFGILTDIAPYTYMRSQDSHPLRSLYFIDELSEPFTALRFALSVRYDFTKHLAAEFAFSGTGTREIRGIEYQSKKKSGPYKKTSDGYVGGQTAYLEWKLGLALHF